jgi:hypothetical protein
MLKVQKMDYTVIATINYIKTAMGVQKHLTDCKLYTVDGKYLASFENDGNNDYSNAGIACECIRHYEKDERLAKDNSEWYISADIHKGWTESVKTFRSELPKELWQLSREDAINEFCKRSKMRLFTFVYYEAVYNNETKTAELSNFYAIKMDRKTAVKFLDYAVYEDSNGKYRLRKYDNFNKPNMISKLNRIINKIKR